MSAGMCGHQIGDRVVVFWRTTEGGGVTSEFRGVVTKLFVERGEAHLYRTVEVRLDDGRTCRVAPQRVRPIEIIDEIGRLGP